MGSGAVGVEMFLADRRGGKAGLVVKVSRPGIGADAFDGYEIAVDAMRQELRLGRHRQNFELLRDVSCTRAGRALVPAGGSHDRDDAGDRSRRARGVAV